MTLTRRSREALHSYRARCEMTRRLAEELRVPEEAVARNIETTNRVTAIGTAAVIAIVFAVIILTGEWV